MDSVWNYRRAELIKFGWAQINQVALVIPGLFLVICEVSNSCRAPSSWTMASASLTLGLLTPGRSQPCFRYRYMRLRVADLETVPPVRDYAACAPRLRRVPARVARALGYERRRRPWHRALLSCLASTRRALRCSCRGSLVSGSHTIRAPGQERTQDVRARPGGSRAGQAGQARAS